MTNEDAITRIKHSSLYIHDRETADYIIKALEQQSSDDCVSRAEAIMTLTGTNLSEKSVDELIALFSKRIRALPPVTPTRKVGKWIYDKTIQNWRCSECNETPKTLGYVGTADFMAEHFRFCNHCGIEMVGDES